MKHWLFVVMMLAAACSKKDGDSKDKGGKADKTEKSDKGDKGDGDKGDKGGGGDDYVDKAKAGEAQVMLKKITARAKEEYNVNASFPTGKVGPTPAKSCCDSGGKCKPDPADWSDPAWKALDFQIDEPFYFQYSYESDGKTFTAKAIGCGGQKTFTASGATSAGNVQIDLSEQ